MVGEVPLRFSTLSKMKRSFSESKPLNYVIENHFYAPTEIWQVVVEFGKSEDYAVRKESWKGVSEYLLYNVHYDYKYVSDIPRKTLLEWKRI